MQYLSSNGDTGISGWINQNTNRLVDSIISGHPTCGFLEDNGLNVKKGILLRSGFMMFLEEFPSIKNPSLLRKVRNRKSTEKALQNIHDGMLPAVRKTKESQQKKGGNVRNDDDDGSKPTTISTQFTPHSIKIIEKIFSSENFTDTFEELHEDGFIDNEKPSNIKAIIVRASMCLILKRLADLQERPMLYQRALTLASSEKTLEAIYQTRYEGYKN